MSKDINQTWDATSDAEKPDPIHIYIHKDVYQIPLATTSAGLALGFLRGSRKASLRFLAENAHNPPKTVEEWYFYHKTKNYRVLLAGLKQSGRDGLRLGAAGALWVGVEQGATRIGLKDYREVCAGLGLAGTVAAVCTSFPPKFSPIFSLVLGSNPTCWEERAI